MDREDKRGTEKQSEDIKQRKVDERGGKEIIVHEKMIGVEMRWEERIGQRK